MKPRIARWWLKLQEYDFTTIHRSGARLAHVDALSRAPVEPATQCEQAGYTYCLTDEQSDWVVAMQHRDERAKYLVDILKGRIKSPQERDIKQKYVITNERLYYKTENEPKFYVPKAVRHNLIRHYHDDMGHFAIERTMQRLQERFWFPKMRKHVKNYINACIKCCYNKSQRCKPEGELHYSEPVAIPFRVLHIDHLGPFITSSKRNAYLLVISDAFSKFCILKAVKNTKTNPVINALKEIFGYFGLPEKIISDRGTAFTAKQFEKYCEDNQIRHIKTAVRTPRANGHVERSNATILSILKTSISNSKQWNEKLEQLQWMLNSQKNATTRFTPNELVFIYNINDVVHNHLVAAVNSDYETTPITTIKEKRAMALQNIENERSKWKARFDKFHGKPSVYNKGDLVVLKYIPSATGESKKLEPLYRGPYIVTRSLGNDRYVVEDVPGLQITNKRFTSVYATDQMKPWCHAYPELNDDREVCSDDEIETDDDHGDHIPEVGTTVLSGMAELSPLNHINE